MANVVLIFFNIHIPKHSLEIGTPSLTQLEKQLRFGEITINVPLFKKLRDIIFFWWENHFLSHFEGHFEGAKTFLTP
jgi:hypothetical protein